MVHANILARVARLLAPSGHLICTAHNSDEGGQMRSWLYAVTDFAADATTNVSRASVSHYIARGLAPAHRLGWMPNGIDVSRFTPSSEARARCRDKFGWPAGEFVWLAVGRFVEPKDYPCLVTAFAMFRGKRGAAGWRLVVAGDGPLRTSIETKIHALRLDGKVSLLGNRSDVSDLMTAADAYVMSSAWEGLPMVLLEASASALPIVTTCAGGNAEIVQDRTTGFVVPIRSPERLASALSLLMDLPPDRRNEMGTRGRGYVAAHYGMDGIVQRWLAAYRNPASLLQPPDGGDALNKSVL